GAAGPPDSALISGATEPDAEGAETSEEPTVEEPVLLASSDARGAARMAVEMAEARHRAVARRATPTLEAPTGQTPSLRAGETVTATVGTLPAGKSVTVLYDATLADPFPVGYGVTARGTVSGSNFTDVALALFTPVVQTVTRTRDFAGTPAEGAEAGWRLLAAPVRGLTVTTLAGQNLVQGISDFYPTYGANLLTDYDGTAFLAPAGGSTVLESGRGFFWYFYDQAINPPGGPSQSVPLPFTLTGTGPAMSGPVTVPLRPAIENMLGNPFPTGLDVTGLQSWAMGGTVQAVAQVYDDVAQSYVPTTLTGNRVEVWQGMFVGSNTATSLVIPPTAQVTTSPNRSAPARAAVAARDDRAAGRASALASRGDVRAARPGGTESEETGATDTRLVAFELRGTAATGQPTLDRAAALYFHPDGTPGWDVWDVAKLYPPTAAYALLSFEGARDGAPAMKAQDSRPLDLSDAFEVPLHVDARGTAGALTLTWPSLTNLPPEWSLRLRDVLRGTIVDLREASSYTFEVAAQPAAPAGAPAGRPASSTGDPRFVLVVSPVATGPEGPAVVPDVFALGGAFPNPVRTGSRIRFDVPEPAVVTVEVFDVLGRRATTVVDGPVAPGRHDVSWSPAGFPSGTYIVRMRARPTSGRAVFEQTRRMTVAR
ncbi:MAG TPA: T9SS type A sorting domain-containing protein, partial [Rubricoccaceae bacterium]